MRPYAVTIPPSSVEEFAVVGDYIRLKTAAVPVTFVVEETGESVVLEPGDAVKLTRFNRVKVMHQSAIGHAIVFYVGNGTSAASSGEVSTTVKGGLAYDRGFSSIGTVSFAFKGATPAIFRRYFFMQNIGGTDLYVMPTWDAVLNQGIKLKPDASYTWDGWVPSGSISAISSAAGGLISWIEGQ